MKKTLLLILMQILICSLIYAGGIVPPRQDPDNPEWVKGEVLIKFKDDVELQIDNSKGIIETGLISLDKLSQKWQVTDMEKVFKTEEKRTETKTIKTYTDEIIEVPQLFNIYKMKVPDETDVEKAVEYFKKNEYVEYAEPNYLYVITDTYPDDPYYVNGNQWYLDRTNAPAAWDLTTGDASQVIAIIDTGVDWDHEDLQGKVWVNSDEIPNNGIDDDNNGFIDDVRGWDFVNIDNDPNDDNCHGTHVAGIAAAHTNNSIGISGISWGSPIMPIKVLQSCGFGNASDIASGIIYASNNEAKMINMSFGGYAESVTVKSALENAYASALLVAAAGNDRLNLDLHDLTNGVYTAFYPACYPFVIGVQASNFSDDLSSFSNFDPSGPIIDGNPRKYGYQYEMIAPGVGLNSSFPNNNYSSLSGTSMASPIVTGAVSLMKSYNPALSNEEVFAKLIQGSNYIIDIENSLDYQLTPDLYYVEYTLIDTLPGCDEDGIADAGETIEIYLTVKNAGGFADSVWSKLRFSQFEDTTTANIIDSTSYIGDISTYASLSGYLDPFVIHINSNVVHNRYIMFEYEICASNNNSISNDLMIKISNGEEISGVIDSCLILTPDKLWLVNSSLMIVPGGILRLLPGTNIKLEQKIVNYGLIESYGTQDSVIYFFGPKAIQGTNSSRGRMMCNYTTFSDLYTDKVFSYLQDSEFDNCVFENFTCDIFWFSQQNNIYRDCTFKNGSAYKFFYCIFSSFCVLNCNFDNIKIRSLSPSRYYSIFSDLTNDQLLKYNNFSRISPENANNDIPIISARNLWNISSSGNNFLNSTNVLSYWAADYDLYEDVPGQYWGTIDPLKIDQKIYDFWDDASYNIVNYEPFLLQPSEEAHGCVWKVLLNGIDPQDEQLEPIGTETVQFKVYFNRPMDISYTPVLTFGVREPYNQHIVIDSSYWSPDSTIWTAFYDVNVGTGDGLNSIRVQSAKDTDSFEIPVENNQRFQFVIQAMGSASIGFTALPGNEEVYLSWSEPNMIDIMGYNMYRYQQINDTTFSETSLINTNLIVDTTYTDTTVDNGTLYFYMFTAISTDFIESEFSDPASAIPYIGVDEWDISPNDIYLYHNYPNPISDKTIIRYYIPSNIKSGTIKIYNVKGQLVNKILLDNRNSTLNTLEWNGKDSKGKFLSNGIYLYRLEASNYKSTIRKMLILR